MRAIWAKFTIPVLASILILGSLGLTQQTFAQVCTAAPPGLVSWWTGDTDASDIQDGNNGVLTNGALAGVAGKVGGAFSFDGINDFVKIPASLNLDVGTSSGFTIDAWINPSATSFRPLVEWNDGGGLSSSVGTHFWLGIFKGSGSLFANIVDTSGAFHFIESAPNVITVNTLQHVAVTYDKITGVATLYKDGTIIEQQNLGSFTPETSSDLYLGHRPPSIGSGFYSGLMDEVEIFDRALSQSEIQDIVNAGSAGKCKVITCGADTELQGTECVVSQALRDQITNLEDALAAALADLVTLQGTLATALAELADAILTITGLETQVDDLETEVEELGQPGPPVANQGEGQGVPAQGKNNKP